MTLSEDCVVWKPGGCEGVCLDNEQHVFNREAGGSIVRVGSVCAEKIVKTMTGGSSTDVAAGHIIRILCSFVHVYYMDGLFGSFRFLTVK